MGQSTPMIFTFGLGKHWWMLMFVCSQWFCFSFASGMTCWPFWISSSSVLQKYTAVYYVLADILMLSMYGYYKMKNKQSNSESLI